VRKLRFERVTTLAGRILSHAVHAALVEALNINNEGEKE
jgi:hypothetical protein